VKRTVGVIGGMGPAATVDFLGRVVEATDVSVEQEHLHILVDCDPSVPDRTAFLLGQGPDPRPHLVRVARSLVLAGAELLVMPCNTAHVWIDDIRDSVKVDVVDWITEVAARVAGEGSVRVGVFATTGTLMARLYQDALASKGVDALLPEEHLQEELMAIVYGSGGVKQAGLSYDLASRLQEIEAKVATEGADAVLLACTEFSLLFRAYERLWDIRVFDAAQIVAERVVSLAGGKLSSHRSSAGRLRQGQRTA
jgi:aspartate racemase